MMRWFRAVLAVGLSLGWSACGAQPVTLPFWGATATPQPQTLTCPVRFGVITSRTGAAAALGQEILNGYQLAVQHINASGGVQLGGRTCSLALVIEDDAGTIAGGQAAFTSLDEAGVPVILGTVSDEVTAALVPLASQYQVPLLAHNANGFLITNRGYDWVFRTLPSAWETVGDLLAYARTLNLPPPTTVALAYEDTTLGHSYAVALIAQAKRQGFVLAGLEAYPSQAENYNEVLYNMHPANDIYPNVMIFAGETVTAGLALLQSAEAIMPEATRPQLFMAGGNVFASPEFLRDPLANHFVLAVPWTADVQRTDTLSEHTNAEFVADYQAAFAGSTPTYRSASAYVNIFLAKAALEGIFSTGPQLESVAQVRQALRFMLSDGHLDEAGLPTGNWGETLLGPVQFDATGQNKLTLLDAIGKPKPTLLIGQVLNQQVQIVYPPELATATLVWPTGTP